MNFLQQAQLAAVVAAPRYLALRDFNGNQVGDRMVVEWSDETNGQIIDFTELSESYIVGCDVWDAAEGGNLIVPGSVAPRIIKEGSTYRLLAGALRLG